MNNTFSLLKLFTSGDLMVLTISLFLAVGSVISWVIIIEKIRLWRAEKMQPVQLRGDDNLD